MKIEPITQDDLDRYIKRHGRPRRAPDDRPPILPSRFMEGKKGGRAYRRTSKHRVRDNHMED